MCDQFKSRVRYFYFYRIRAVCKVNRHYGKCICWRKNVLTACFSEYQALSEKGSVLKGKQFF